MNAEFRENGCDTVAISLREPKWASDRWVPSLNPLNMMIYPELTGHMSRAPAMIKGGTNVTNHPGPFECGSQVSSMMKGGGDALVPDTVVLNHHPGGPDCRDDGRRGPLDQPVLRFTDGDRFGRLRRGGSHFLRTGHR